MMRKQSLPWKDPLELASGVDEAYFVLLYSGTAGTNSYLACGLRERVEAGNFTDFEKKLESNRSAFDHSWFGYLGYGLKDCLEQLTSDAPNWLALPHLCMMRFSTLYHFDHEAHTLTCWSDSDTPLPVPRARNAAIPAISNVQSNMSRNDYLQKAAQVIERIRAGDLYQANLTRKFMGEFADTPDAFALFTSLCKASPAAYSAYIRLNDTHIVSSSPELFLRISPQGRIESQPIKGSAPRFADAAQDQASRARLEASTKDKAENLMIVDLMRNDLARACLPGSVKANELFTVTSHATIHHMSSLVAGQKRGECSTLDVVKACFPPGSMTGAPKIKAMNLCSALEQQARGVYSGAIGWFGGDGSAELSVVIRTLLVRNRRFEFQVGGGIVADSTPEGELQEIFAKSNGLLTALGLDIRALEGL